MKIKKITPFLSFKDQAEEAAKFYVSIFKKNSKINHVARYGSVGPGPKGKAMSVIFTLEGETFYALNGGPAGFTPAISFFVSCKTQKEVDYYWNKLTAGGSPVQCGWLRDKYGLSWQIVPTVLNEELLTTKDQEKADRVMKAMMGMVKFDVQALKDAAADGATKKTRKKGSKKAQ